MPEYNIEFLAPAWRELDEISQLHFSLVGAKSAERITSKILDMIERLRTTPYMGMAVDEPLIRHENYRRLVCERYLCFYKVIGNTVYIYHIIDGRRDYPRLLEQS